MHDALIRSRCPRSAPHAAFIAALVCGLALAALAPSPARACSCMQASVPEAYEAAVAVFEGHVLELQTVEPSPSAPGYRSVRMQVVRAWKGVESEEVVITTPLDSAGCGYDFSVDQSYLVYAAAQGGGLQVSLCSRTSPIARAGDDLKTLGMGATPVDPKKQDTPAAAVPPREEPPARGGCAGCTLGSGPGAALGAAPLLLLLAGLRARARAVTSRRRSGSRS